MRDEDKTKDQLIRELEELRQRIDDPRQPEEYYRILFNNTYDAAFAYRLTEEGGPGRFIEVNDIACRRLGYTREQLLKMSRLDIAAAVKEDSIPMLMTDLLANEPIVFESVLRAKDENELHVEVSAHLFDLEGKPTVLSVARDITERKQIGRRA